MAPVSTTMVVAAPEPGAVLMVARAALGARVDGRADGALAARLARR